MAVFNYLKEPCPESLEEPVPVTALPLLTLEESDIVEPEEFFSEELILPVSLAEPVPVTALPVLDAELTGTESCIVVASDESELLQDAKQKVAAIKIKIVICFMNRCLINFLCLIILIQKPARKRLGQDIRKASNSP